MITDIIVVTLTIRLLHVIAGAAKDAANMADMVARAGVVGNNLKGAGSCSSLFPAPFLF